MLEHPRSRLKCNGLDAYDTLSPDLHPFCVDGQQCRGRTTVSRLVARQRGITGILSRQASLLLTTTFLRKGLGPWRCLERQAECAKVFRTVRCLLLYVSHTEICEDHLIRPQAFYARVHRQSNIFISRDQRPWAPPLPLAAAAPRRRACRAHACRARPSRRLWCPQGRRAHVARCPPPR
eukprot:6190476-Pleurochrysis_carterae.AAC.5